MIDDVLMIVPAFNEAAVIGATLAELKRAASQILVVDDGSSDGTAEVARRAGAEVLRLGANLNYGGALQAGFRYAVSRTDLPYVAAFDADGQHDPAFLPDLIAPLRSRRADYVVGSRYLSDLVSPTSIAREYGHKAFAALASAILGRRITDPTSGQIALTREVAQVLTLDLFPQDYPDADVIIMLDRMGFAALEVPIAVRPSRSGKSMHGGLLKPLYYVYKMSLAMLIVSTRGDLAAKRKEARIAA